MYGVDAVELANIEGAITRTTAMIELCEKHSAPAESIEYLQEQLRGYYNEKMQMLGNGIQPDYERLAFKSQMIERLLDALDPDQNDNVSWWVD